MSLILVTLSSFNDSDFERSNLNLEENKADGVDLNSNDLDYCVRKNKEKILWFSADCTDPYGNISRHNHGSQRCVGSFSLSKTTHKFKKVDD